jgi:hypothetical protein
MLERRAVKELHDEEGASVFFPDVVGCLEFQTIS